MIASVKQGESVSSERYKKKRKRQKKTDALAHGAGDHMKQEDGREAGMIDKIPASETEGGDNKKGPDGIAVGP